MQEDYAVLFKENFIQNKKIPRIMKPKEWSTLLQTEKFHLLHKI